MKIVSNYKDYYDNVHGFYSDEPLYIRKEEEIELEVKNKRYIHRIFTQTVNSAIIGFCGTEYKCLFTSYYADKNYYFYDANSFISYYTNKYPKEKLSKYDINNIKDFFVRSTVAVDKHKKYGPIYYIGHDNTSYPTKEILIKNFSRLNTVQFYRVLDAQQAYQTLERYISNDLCTELFPIPDNVPDKYLKRQKGFDSWSFRKQPTKKGRKPKVRK